MCLLISKISVKPVVFAKDTYNNERQKISITFIKKDAETERPLADGVFGLFVGLGASALIAGVAMMKGRKKKEDEEETVNQ